MSLRGVRFAFEPGEYVLCFEPDLTKARVLYDAKIQEQSITRDSKTRRRPEYHIHFQGWNSSWDRVVPECFIVKDNQENRALMRRLANIARQFKSNKPRLRKIDNILKEHFGRRLKFDSDTSDSESASGGESTGDDDDDTDEDEDEEDEDEMEGEGRGPGMWQQEDEEIQIRASNGRQNGDLHDEDSDAGEEELEDLENKENELSRTEADGCEIEEGVVQTDLDLEIPTNLRHKLEDDCYYINTKSKLLSLPADPNVITVLEGYIKNFAVNVLCATVEKPRGPNLRDSATDDSPPPERNIEMCKEVMDGLRVFFDFALPAILLYNVERAQYGQLSSANTRTALRPQSITIKQELRDPESEMEEEVLHSPRLRSASRLNSPRSPGHAAEPFAKVARLSPRPHRREALEEEDAEEEEEEDEVPCRRMTRRSFAAEVHSSSRQQSGDESPRRGGGAALADSASPRQRRNSLRSKGRSTGSGGGGASNRSSKTPAAAGGSKTKVENGTDEDKPALSERVTPPPPLLIPASISSHGTGSWAAGAAAGGECTPTSSMAGAAAVPAGGSHEAAVNDIFSWNMLPDKWLMDKNAPFMPSTVYGSHHLLRLFVKLPALLAEMLIPEAKMSALNMHLQLFLEYLSNRCDELFPDSVYIDNATDSCKPSTPRHR